MTKSAICKHKWIFYRMNFLCKSTLQAGPGCQLSHSGYVALLTLSLGSSAGCGKLKTINATQCSPKGLGRGYPCLPGSIELSVTVGVWGRKRHF